MAALLRIDASALIPEPSKLLSLLGVPFHSGPSPIGIGVPLGIPGLDEFFQVYPGDRILIQGPPQSGKSLFAYHIGAMLMWHGHTIEFYAGEHIDGFIMVNQALIRYRQLHGDTLIQRDKIVFLDTPPSDLIMDPGDTSEVSKCMDLFLGRSPVNPSIVVLVEPRHLFFVPMRDKIQRRATVILSTEFRGSHRVSVGFNRVFPGSEHRSRDIRSARCVPYDLLPPAVPRPI